MDEILDDFNPHAWVKTPAAKIYGPTFPGQLQAVAFGGGTDSTAVLIGMRDRGLKPDFIVFSDTGGEQPATYAFVELMNEWAIKNFGIKIDRVQKTYFGQPDTLEGESLRRGRLPSLAMGLKECSTHFKVRPQERFMNKQPRAIEAWKRGERIIKYIGYEAGEARRVRPQESKDGKYLFQYPLIAWGWYRQQCLEAIKKEGLPQPGKSSCFFCPAMKKKEIAALPKDLQDRAIAMERAAAPNMKTIKGLGRSFSWEDYLAGRCDITEPFLPGVPCDCYDGTEEP